MAQVIRKYETGTSAVTPSESNKQEKPKSLGKVIVNGVKYDVTEDWLNNIEKYSDQGAAWAKILREGNDQYLYTDSNGYKFADAAEDAQRLGDLNDRQTRKMGLIGRGGRKVRNEKANWHKLGEQIIGTIKKPEPTTWILSELPISYTEENGVKKVNATDLIKINTHFDKINELSEKDFDEYTFWDKSLTKDKVIPLLKRAKILKEAIKEGILTDDFINEAKGYGIKLTGPKEEIPVTSSPTGQIVLTDSENKPIEMYVSGKLNPNHWLSNVEEVKANPMGAFFFGEKFRNRYPNSPIKQDAFLINGKLYYANADELKALPQYSDWIRYNQGRDFTSANNTIYQAWDNENWSPITTDLGTLLYAPQNAKYASDVTNLYNGGEGNRVIRFIGDTTGSNAYGHPILSEDQLVVVDKSGQVVSVKPTRRGTPVLDYQSNLGYTAAVENPFESIVDNPIYQVLAIGNPNNNGIYKIGNKYYYFDRGYDRNIKSGSGLGSANNYAVEIPETWIPTLYKNLEALRNEDIRRNLSQIIYATTRPGGVTYDSGNYIVDPGFGNRNYKVKSDFLKELLKPYQNSIPETTRLQFKQTGGVYDKGDGSTQKQAVLKTEAKSRGKGEEKTFGDGTSFTKAEKAELAALALDGASFLASFVPGAGNIASAGLGIVGSATQFGADVARDGFDFGDLAALGANVGMDALTLISGPMGKSVKLAKALSSSKAVKRAVQVVAGLSTTASASGILASWDRIQKGEFKTEDLRNILNVVRGVTGLSRSMGSAIKTNTPDTATAKIGNTEATITKAEWERIKKLPKSQQKAELEKLLPNRKLTLEEAKEQVLAARKQANPSITEAELNKGLNKAAQDLVDSPTTQVKMTLDEAGISYSPKRKWFPVERLGFSPEFVSQDSYIDPKSVPWYKPATKYAAEVDARINSENPHHAAEVLNAPARQRIDLRPKEVVLKSPDGSVLTIPREVYDQLQNTKLTALQRINILNRYGTQAPTKSRIAYEINSKRKAEGKKALSGKLLENAIDKYIQSGKRPKRVSLKDFGVIVTKNGVTIPNNPMSLNDVYRKFNPLVIHKFESWNSNEPAQPDVKDFYYYKDGGKIQKWQKGKGDVTTGEKDPSGFMQALGGFNWKQLFNDSARLYNDIRTINKTSGKEMEAARYRGQAMKSLIPDYQENYNFSTILKEIEDAKKSVDTSVKNVVKSQTDNKLSAGVQLAGASQKADITGKGYNEMSRHIDTTNARNAERNYNTLIHNIERADYNNALGKETAANLADIEAKRDLAIGTTINSVLTEQGQRIALEDKEKQAANSALDKLNAYENYQKGLSTIPTDATEADKAAYKQYLSGLYRNIVSVSDYNSGTNRVFYIPRILGKTGENTWLDYTKWKSQNNK